MTVTAEGARVLVTGASSGIGRATALAYARRGARLVLLARSPGLLAEVAAECQDAGAAAAVVAVADVHDVAAVEASVDLAMIRFGGLDVCVHSVAVVAYGRIEDVPADVWNRTVTTAAVGTSNVARAALVLFRRQERGTLVVVGSVLGQVAVPYMGAYVTGKWAIRGLVRVLQQEARQTPGVHVALVNPGAIDTPIYPRAATYVGREGRPPPPVQGPEAVADAVLRVVDRRRKQTAVGRANGVMRLGFTVTPWLFDRLAGPMLRLAGMRRSPADPTTGNVDRPSEDLEHLRS